MSKVAKKMLWVLLVAGVAFAGTRWDLNVGNRTSVIYAPTNRSNPALVIAMHGMGLGAWWTPGAMKFEALADTANFIVAYPQGENNVWDLNGTKDVNFILAIVDSMYNRYQIDRNRVYATGFSMGGMMSWALACKIPDKIAAIVGGNGYPLGGLSGCSEVRHVPALQIHGTADDFVSYTGFVNNFMPSQRTRYGCPSTSVKTNPYPVGVNGRNASQLAQPVRSFMDYYGPCVKNGLTSELSLLSVNGMIHDWATPDKANTNEDPAYTGKPLEVNGTWEAWNFMRKHSLTGSTPVVTVPAHRDTIFNGKFDQGSTGWTLNTWGGTAQGSVVGGEYKIEISALGTANSSLQLIQNGLILVQGKTYEVKFDAYASATRPLEVNVELDVSPWTSYLPALQNFNLTTSKTSYTFAFNMVNATDSNGRLSFNAGASTTTLFVDNISIRELDTPVLVRNEYLRHGFLSVVRQGTQVDVQLTGAKGKAFTMGLYNLAGKPVRMGSKQINEQGSASWTANLEGLSQGIYFVKVNSDGVTIHSSKLMISK